MERTIKNAKIKSTFLGIEDHNIPTFFINLDYGGAGQSFGGYDLRYYGIDIILKILKVLDKDSWESLNGYIRVDADYEKIYRIGHIVEDSWFDIEKHKTEIKRKKNGD